MAEVEPGLCPTGLRPCFSEETSSTPLALGMNTDGFRWLFQKRKKPNNNNEKRKSRQGTSLTPATHAARGQEEAGWCIGCESCPSCASLNPRRGCCCCGEGCTPSRCSCWPLPCLQELRTRACWICHRLLAGCCLTSLQPEMSEEMPHFPTKCSKHLFASHHESLVLSAAQERAVLQRIPQRPLWPALQPASSSESQASSPRSPSAASACRTR